MAERVVLDPGHGGSALAGVSSPFGVRGPNGSLEKHLTLALARLVRERLATCGVAAQLTRAADQNRSLAERIAQARDAAADAFVSLHFNAAPDPSLSGREVFVHAAASAQSKALGAQLRAALLPARPRQAVLAVLDPASHLATTAASLVELDYLTNPAVERRLADLSYLVQLADALAGGIRSFLNAPAADGGGEPEQPSEHFDIWHEVPLVPQLTGMSCWAAAAAMIVGWRDCLDVRPEDVALGAGAWAQYRDGLEPLSVRALARTFGLVAESPRVYTLKAVRQLLEYHGPLWVGAGPTGLHVVVVSGMYGDGSLEGSFVRVLDPWPIGRGERYTISVRELARNLEEASQAAGVRACILHCGALLRGRARRAAQSQHANDWPARFGRAVQRLP
jgi:hypothetical protein